MEIKVSLLLAMSVLSKESNIKLTNVNATIRKFRLLVFCGNKLIFRENGIVQIISYGFSNDKLR